MIRILKTAQGVAHQIEQAAKPIVDGAAAAVGGGAALATWLGYIETGLGLILMIGSILLVGLRLKLTWAEHKEKQEKSK